MAETGNAYASARKQGRKYLAEHAGSDTKGYLPTLEERLAGVNIIGEINMGYHEIPLKKIIGTRTEARSTAFAGNFMPLLDENTEFAAKWEAVYESQLQEGIREPILVFEYINRYYVQEGNKRVSILNFVGAEAIAANIIRLIPQRDESNLEISIYYEFLDFDRHVFFDNLWFSKRRRFTTLVTQAERYLKAHPEIPDDIGTAINSVHRSFREAVRRVGFKDLNITTGDALVEYINIFGFPYKSKQSEMMKNLKQIYPQLLIISAGREREAVEGPDEAEIPSPVWSIFSKKPRLTVAFALDSEQDNGSWNQLHTYAIEKVREKFGTDIELRTLPDVSPAKVKGYFQLADFVAKEKPDILFTTSKSMSDASLRLTLENPDMIVLNCDRAKENKNLNTYFCKMYDITFLCGILAGIETGSDIIGYVDTSMFTHQMSYGVDAFSLGASMINPRVKVLECRPEHMNNLDEHAEIRRKFVAQGADVAFCRHIFGDPQAAAAPINTLAQVYRLDDSACNGKDSLCAVTCDWSVLYSHIISETRYNRAGMLSTTKGGGNPIHFGWGLSADLMDVVCTEAVKWKTQRFLGLMKSMVNGQRLRPFAGPVYDNEGVLRIDDDFVPTVVEVQRIAWLESSVVEIK